MNSFFVYSDLHDNLKLDSVSKNLPKKAAQTAAEKDQEKAKSLKIQLLISFPMYLGQRFLVTEVCQKFLCGIHAVKIIQ